MLTRPSVGLKGILRQIRRRSLLPYGESLRARTGRNANTERVTGPMTTSQISQFKRDGLLVLPGVLDLDLCRQARDQLWNTLAVHLPRSQREDSFAWGPLADEEEAMLPQTVDGVDAYCWGNGHRIYIRNGAEDLLRALAPRALWDVAEQLLGEGEVVWTGGLHASGVTTPPCLMARDVVSTLADHRPAHCGDWPEGWYRHD